MMMHSGGLMAWMFLVDNGIGMGLVFCLWVGLSIGFRSS